MAVSTSPALMAMALIMQEVSAEREIEIPDQVRDIYKQWRPTPLFRARRLEAALEPRSDGAIGLFSCRPDQFRIEARSFSPSKPRCRRDGVQEKPTVFYFFRIKVFCYPTFA